MMNQPSIVFVTAVALLSGAVTFLILYQNHQDAAQPQQLTAVEQMAPLTPQPLTADPQPKLSFVWIPARSSR